MIVEARRRGPPHVLRFAPARDCDEFDRRAPRRRTDLFCYLIAVHLRHADVEQHHFGLCGGGDLERLLAIASIEDLMAIKLKQQLESCGGVWIVVGDDYPARLL